MKHARDDYNERIQDTAGKIPEKEPVFLIRGQDCIAPVTVKFWADLAEKAGAAPNIVSAARQQVIEMREWQKTHKPKVPDMP